MRSRTVRSLMVGALAGLLAAATGAALARRARRRDRNQGWSAIDPGFRLPSPDPSAFIPVVDEVGPLRCGAGEAGER